MSTTPLQRMMFIQGQLCFFCNQTIPSGEASVEHLHPVSLGGSDHTDNLVACCKTLNALFGNMTVKDKIRTILRQNGKFVCPNRPSQHPPYPGAAPQAQAQTPKPQGQASQPQAQASKPQAQTPQPQAQAPKPQTQAPKPQQAPQPQAQAPKLQLPKPVAPHPTTSTTSPSAINPLPTEFLFVNNGASGLDGSREP